MKFCPPSHTLLSQKEEALSFELRKVKIGYREISGKPLEIWDLPNTVLRTSIDERKISLDKLENNLIMTGNEKYNTSECAVCS